MIKYASMIIIVAAGERKIRLICSVVAISNSDRTIIQSISLRVHVNTIN